MTLATSTSTGQTPRICLPSQSKFRSMASLQKPINRCRLSCDMTTCEKAWLTGSRESNLSSNSSRLLFANHENVHRDRQKLSNCAHRHSLRCIIPIQRRAFHQWISTPSNLFPTKMWEAPKTTSSICRSWWATKVVREMLTLSLRWRILNLHWFLPGDHNLTLGLSVALVSNLCLPLNSTMCTLTVLLTMNLTWSAKSTTARHSSKMPITLPTNTSTTCLSSHKTKVQTSAEETYTREMVLQMIML